MRKYHEKHSSLFIWALVWILSAAFVFNGTATAQTTAFNFQGRLNDGANPANGNVEMQFKLFDALVGGTQIGATLSRPNVAVINGIFSTPLDFGATAFDGSNRFVEIGVRPAGSTNGFTTLNPRQPILSTPYAIQAKNSAQLGGIPASEYVTTTTVGSSYIRNATTQQTGNFNISGNGIVGGNVGIGIAPAAGIKLDVNGATLVRTTGTGGNIQFGNPNGETGMSIVNTNRADIKFDNSSLRLVVGSGTTPPLNSNGLSISTSGDVGIGTTIPQAKLSVAGNAAQSRDKGGLVKAMLAVNAAGQIDRCYNGITGSDTGDCGFSVAHSLGGIYSINFNFQVNDRFVSVTPQFNSIVFASHASLVFTGTNIIEVNISLSGFQTSGGLVQASFLSSQPFMIIVY